MKKIKIVMFIGPSGSGKSTCVKALTGEKFRPLLENGLSKYFRMEQYSTREPREDELVDNNSPYVFISDNRFDILVSDGIIFEERSYDMINSKGESVTVRYGSSLHGTIDTINEYNEDPTNAVANKDNYCITAECTLEMVSSYINMVMKLNSDPDHTFGNKNYQIELVPIVIKNKDSRRLREIMNRDCKHNDDKLDEVIRRFAQDKIDFSDLNFYHMYDMVADFNKFIVDRGAGNIIYPRTINNEYGHSMDNLLEAIKHII